MKRERRTTHTLPDETSGKRTGKDRDAAKTSEKELDMPIRERGRGGIDLGL